MLARSLLSSRICVSVTRRYCIETDKYIIKLFSQPCSPTTMGSSYHIWLRNSNGKRSLSLGWTLFFFGPKRLTMAVLESKRPLIVIVRPIKIVQLIGNLGVWFQIRNFFIPTTYGSRGTAHAHCQFYDLRLKSPLISETIQDRPIVPT